MERKIGGWVSKSRRGLESTRLRPRSTSRQNLGRHLRYAAALRQRQCNLDSSFSFPAGAAMVQVGQVIGGRKLRLCHEGPLAGGAFRLGRWGGGGDGEMGRGCGMGGVAIAQSMWWGGGILGLGHREAAYGHVFAVFHWPLQARVADCVATPRSPVELPLHPVLPLGCCTLAAVLGNSYVGECTAGPCCRPRAVPPRTWYCGSGPMFPGTFWLWAWKEEPFLVLLLSSALGPITTPRTCLHPPGRWLALRSG